VNYPLTITASLFFLVFYWYSVIASPRMNIRKKIREMFSAKVEPPNTRGRSPKTGLIHRAEPSDRYSVGRFGDFSPAYLAGVFLDAESGDISRQAELYEIMEGDAHLLSQMLIRKNAVCGLGYDIVGGRDSVRSEAADMLANIGYSVHPQYRDSAIVPSWDEIVFDMLDAIGKGFSLGEIEWDLSEGQAAVATVWHIDAKRVSFRDSILPRLITKSDPNGIHLPPRKFIYHRFRAKTGADTSAGLMTLSVTSERMLPGLYRDLWKLN